MKRIIYLIPILLIAISCLGQAPLAKQWDRRFGGTDFDELGWFEQTFDGGYILGGTSNSDSSDNKTQSHWGLSDYWVIKIDSVGNKQWDGRFGGTDLDKLTELRQIIDSGYILCGYSYSDSSGDKTQPGWGNLDFWAVKIDKHGNKQWDKRYGGTQQDQFNALDHTSDGGYVFAGYSASDSSGDKTEFSRGGSDYWIIKTDSLGVKQWDKTLGGPSSEWLRSIKQTKDGGYIIGGYTGSSPGGDVSQPSRGLHDYWIVKTDALGNKQWDKRFGGSYEDDLEVVLPTADGGYLLGGTSDSPVSGDKSEPLKGMKDYWIVKVDSLGSKQWDKDFGGSRNEEFFHIEVSRDNHYILSGESYSPASGNKSENNLGEEQTWIIKIDTLGGIEWEKTILTNGHDENSYLLQTPDGSYVIANNSDGFIGGEKTQQPWDSSYDYWIIKFSDTSSQASSTCHLISADISANKIMFCSGDSVRLTVTTNVAAGDTVLDQTQTVYNGGTSARTLPGYSEWQSFTAGITGTLTQLDIGFFTLINGVGQLSIYAGTGTGGALLWRQNVNVVCGGGNCLLSFSVSAPVVAGQVYTFEFIPGAGMPDPYGIQVANPGPYAGGEMKLVDPTGTYPTGFDMVFNTYVSTGSTLSYLWSNGDQDSVTTVHSGGTYVVTVSESSGCSEVESITITQDVVRLSFNTVHTTCGNDNGTLQLNISGISPFDIEWSSGDSTTTIDSLEPGVYSVLVVDSLGCEATASATINSSVPISVSIHAADSVICANDSVLICAPTIFLNYHWNNGSPNQCITTNQAGNYYVTVTNGNGCSAESNHLLITVLPLPPVSISVNGDTLTVNNSTQQQWYRNGSAINGATGNTYIATQGGSYTVMVTDSNGCWATSSSVIVSGIESVTREDLVIVYPNPLSVDGCLLSVGASFIGGKAEVFDADGKLVFYLPLATNHSLLAPEVPKGIYLLRISSGNSSVVRKLVRL